MSWHKDVGGNGDIVLQPITVLRVMFLADGELTAGQLRVMTARIRGRIAEIDLRGSALSPRRGVPGPVSARKPEVP